jgi:hypothetical protein
MTKNKFLKLIEPYHPCIDGLDFIANCKNMEEVFKELRHDKDYVLVLQNELVTMLNFIDEGTSCLPQQIRDNAFMTSNMLDILRVRK